MRVNLKARIPMHLYQEFHSLPLVLTIETAHGLAARCEHRTTAAELMWTLDQKTNINTGLLDRFRQKLRLIEEANLSDVEVSDEVLDMFGFFLYAFHFRCIERYDRRRGFSSRIDAHRCTCRCSVEVKCFRPHDFAPPSSSFNSRARRNPAKASCRSTTGRSRR
jgi:hypothetical protein